MPPQLPVGTAVLRLLRSRRQAGSPLRPARFHESSIKVEILFNLCKFKEKMLADCYRKGRFLDFFLFCSDRFVLHGGWASGRDAEGWSVHAVGLGCGRAGAGTAADSGSVKRLRPEVAAGCRSGRARCRYAAVGPGEFRGRTRGWIQEEDVEAGLGLGGGARTQGSNL